MTIKEIIKAKWMAVAPIITVERAYESIIEEWGEFMFWIGSQGWEDYGGSQYIISKTMQVADIRELYEEFLEYAAKHEIL